MDHAAVFTALPTAYLVMTPDLVIAGANDAYLASVGRTRDEIVGRDVFEAFPPTADALDESGVSRVQLSFEKAVTSGRTDTMPLQKYDIPDGAGGLTEKYWSLIHVPVLDDEDRTVLLLQRAEDVTEYVKERERGLAERERSEAAHRKVEEVEADLFARGEELRAALREAEVAGRRLAGLAEVALQLTGAQTVEDLTGIVVDRGMVALGADGGAVAVREGNVMRLALTSSLGGRARQELSEMPVHGSLPASVTARTGERILMRDAAEAVAFDAGMRDVVAATDCQAWAVLPLVAGSRILGALCVGWKAAQEFPAAELEILDAMAAQCAQGLDRIQIRAAERRSAAAARRMSETLQRSLLTEPPRAPGLQIAVRYRPAAREAQVGGDWYDAFRNADGGTSLVIGDVAGHDRDAAAAMGQFRNLLRGIAYAVAEPPAAVLSTLDRAVRDLAVGSLATAVLARVEPAPDDGPGARLVTWSNAGHPPPLLVEPDGTVHLLHTDPDLLLGLDPETGRADHSRVVRPGATLLLFTDGLVERRHAALDSGLDTLVDAVRSLDGRPLDDLCDALLDRLGSAGDDDIALLALRVEAMA